MGNVYIEDPAHELRLRELQQEDMDLLLKMLNDPRIEYSVIGWGLTVSATQQKHWFDELRTKRDRTMYLIIEEKEIPVGCFILTNFDREAGTAEVGIKILRTSQGRMMTQWATRIFLQYCYETLGIRCLYAYCLSLQRATIRLVKAMHFTIEGVQRSAIYKHGRRWDIVHFSLLREEYEGSKEL